MSAGHGACRESDAADIALSFFCAAPSESLSPETNKSKNLGSGQSPVSRRLCQASFYRILIGCSIPPTKVFSFSGRGVQFWATYSNADGQLFLLSDQNLDVFQYHTDWESVTWEKSTMRSWLNGDGASENTGGDSGTDYTSDNFISTAFSEKEQAAIADTEVVK